METGYMVKLIVIELACLSFRRVRHGRGHGVPLLLGGLGAQRRHPGAALLHEQGTPGGHQEDAEVQRREGLMIGSNNCQKIVVPVLASPRTIFSCMKLFVALVVPLPVRVLSLIYS